MTCLCQLLAFLVFTASDAKNKPAEGRFFGNAAVKLHDGLRDLRLVKVRLTPADIDGVAKLRQLTRLGLPGCNVDDSAFAKLAVLTGLEELDLTDTKVSDAGMATLAKFPKLRWLYLGRTAIADKGLESLEDCTELCGLHLSDTAMTDAGLVHLRRLVNLRVLNVGGTKLTDAGMRHLGGFKNLMRLNISRTAVTDAQLSHLTHLDRLSYFEYQDSKVTKGAVAGLYEAIQKSWPQERREHEAAIQLLFEFAKKKCEEGPTEGVAAYSAVAQTCAKMGASGVVLAEALSGMARADIIRQKAMSYAPPIFLMTAEMSINQALAMQLAEVGRYNLDYVRMLAERAEILFASKRRDEAERDLLDAYGITHRLGHRAVTDALVQCYAEGAGTTTEAARRTLQEAE